MYTRLTPSRVLKRPYSTSTWKREMIVSCGGKMMALNSTK